MSNRDPYSDSWLFFLWPAAELAPLLHFADECLLAPLLLSGLHALTAQETGRLAYLCHAIYYNLSLGLWKKNSIARQPQIPIAIDCH